MTPEHLENEVEGTMTFEQSDKSYDDAGAVGDIPHDMPDDAESKAQKEAKALFAEIDAAAQEEPLAFDDEDEHSDLDSVPVTLSFELGKASLPLADVRTLGPGAVVLFAGGSPASVAIVSAGQTLGYGEIVDVEGRLGIRVTRWRKP